MFRAFGGLRVRFGGSGRTRPGGWRLADPAPDLTPGWSGHGRTAGPELGRFALQLDDTYLILQPCGGGVDGLKERGPFSLCCRPPSRHLKQSHHVMPASDSLSNVVPSLRSDLQAPFLSEWRLLLLGQIACRFIGEPLLGIMLALSPPCEPNRLDRFYLLIARAWVNYGHDEIKATLGSWVRDAVS